MRFIWISIGKVLSLCSAISPLLAKETEEIIIFHTNDWQSHLLGFGPNQDYSPETMDNDDTVGGVARLAGLLQKRRKFHGKSVPSLTLDGGDFTMGSLFQTVTRTHAEELRLLAKLGYDPVALGNHELDLGPQGLASSIKVPHEKENRVPPILCGNIQFSKLPADHSLEEAMRAENLRRKLVLNPDGLKIGLFGILGKTAIDVAKGAPPLTFEDPIESSRKIVDELRNQDKVDLVIALSHSGFTPAKGTFGYRRDDIDLAKQVSGINIIVSGHTHFAASTPVMVGQPLIVQAGSEIQFLGELKVIRSHHGQWKLADYQFHPIDDRIPGHWEIPDFVSNIKKLLTQEVLAPYGLSFDERITQISRKWKRKSFDHNPGWLVSAAIRKASNANFAFTVSDVQQADLLKGKNGFLTVSDIFRLSPLGWNLTEDKPGFPIVQMYFTGEELRNQAELAIELPNQTDNSYTRQIFLAGLRTTYNPNRPNIDQVTKQWRLPKHGGSKEPVPVLDDQLYSVATSWYVASFLKNSIEPVKFLLPLQARNSDEKPLEHVSDSHFDSSIKPGIQEVVVWEETFAFLKGLQDNNSAGISDLHWNSIEAIESPVPKPSIAPWDLSRNTRKLTHGILSLVIVGAVLLGFVLKKTIRAQTH